MMWLARRNPLTLGRTNLRRHQWRWFGAIAVVYCLVAGEPTDAGAQEPVGNARKSTPSDAIRTGEPEGNARKSTPSDATRTGEPEGNARKSTPSDAIRASEPAKVTSEIYVIGNHADYENLRDVIGRNRIGTVEVTWSKLEKLNPEALLRPLGPPALTVRCWIDLSHQGTVLLYFADRSSKRFLVRQVSVARTPNEVEKETIAQIVEVSISALTDDATPGLTRDNVEALLGIRAPSGVVSTPSQAAPFVTVETSGPWYRQTFGAGYLVEAFSAEIPWVHGPFASLGIAHMGQKTLSSVELHVGYQLPASYAANAVGVRLSAIRLRCNVGLDLPIFRSDGLGEPGLVSVGMVLGAGANVTFVQPVGGNLRGAVTFEPDQTIWLPLVDAGLRLRRSFHRWFLAIGGNAELDLQQVSYDVLQSGHTATVVRPYRLRPSLQLEVGAL